MQPIHSYPIAYSAFSPIVKRMNLFEEIIAALFPQMCVACGKKGSALCAICERGVCVRPRVMGEGIVALFEYHQPIVKKAITEFKYGNKKALGAYFGTALYREFFAPLSKQKDAPEIILVPVPTGNKGEEKRGYNHTAEIARGITKAGRAFGVRMSVAPVLAKRKGVLAQVAAGDPSMRKRNMQSALRVTDRLAVRGKHVVIIDDVITTGATMREAIRACEAAGAGRVVAIAVAH